MGRIIDVTQEEKKLNADYADKTINNPSFI